MGINQAVGSTNACACDFECMTAYIQEVLDEILRRLLRAFTVAALGAGRHQDEIRTQGSFDLGCAGVRGLAHLGLFIDTFDSNW